MPTRAQAIAEAEKHAKVEISVLPKVTKKGFIATKQSKKKATARIAPVEEFDAETESMLVDSRHYFAFSGFPKSSEHFEIFTVSQELVAQFLPEFSLEVYGVATYQEDLAVAIEYFASQGEGLERKVHELRDAFKYKGSILSAITVEDSFISAFGKPIPRLPSSGSADLPRLPESPGPGHGIKSKHSGWSPEITMRREQVKEFFTRHGAAPTPLAAVPVPPDAESGLDLVLTKLNELTVGVNELRASQATAVTRADLQEFHDKSNAETRAFVLSQTEPLNESVAHLLKSEVENFDRVGRLESRVDKIAKPKGPDLSFQQLAVVQFPENAALEDRLEAMQTFMRTQFPKVHVKGVSVIHRGDWKERGKNRSMTRVGLIDVGNADVREYIVKIIEAKDLKIPCAGKSLKIVRAMTDNAKDRNTALTGAADLLKKQPGLSAKDVSIEWTGSRSVKVKGAIAYEQPVGRDLGSFCGAYAHLKLP